MLVTVDDLVDKYGFTISDKARQQFQTILDTAEEECLAYAGLEIGEINEYLDGDGGCVYCISHKPVQRIVSVTVDGRSVSYRFEKRSQKIVLECSVSMKTEIVVTMMLGWETGSEPSTLKTAIALTAQHLAKLQNAKMMGILTRTTEGGSEQIEQSIPPLAVKGLLDRFKSVVM